MIRIKNDVYTKKQKLKSHVYWKVPIRNIIEWDIVQSYFRYSILFNLLLQCKIEIPEKELYTPYINLFYFPEIIRKIIDSGFKITDSKVFFRHITSMYLTSNSYKSLDLLLGEGGGAQYLNKGKWDKYIFKGPLLRIFLKHGFKIKPEMIFDSSCNEILKKRKL